MADFSSPAYKRSRAAYVAQSTFEYFITLVVADAFLAKLLTSLGVSDAMAGIIASFVSLVFVVQIFSILLVKGRMGSRSLSMIFETLSQLCFASIYFIPFFARIEGSEAYYRDPRDPFCVRIEVSRIFHSF